MNFRGYFITASIIFSSFSLSGQQNSDTVPFPAPGNNRVISGFIRGGFYGNLDKNSSKPFISSGYSDLGLKFESSLRNNFKGFADIRFRYGSEFTKTVNSITVREAYAEFSINSLNLTAGQRIIKWGRADFTNPTSKFNPQNFISRSPDREDMDMGNLIASARWSPGKILSFQAIAVPFYKSSVLIIDPVKLPENVKINQLNGLLTAEGLMSYGFKTDFHLRGIDFGASYFEGYDPMPGIALTQFTIDLSGPVPVTSTELTVTPYKTRMLGLDFESSLGSLGIRGEAAWSVPDKSYLTNENVPLPEIKWVAGADFSAGNWRITGEYSGKYITHYTVSPADPILGTETDNAKLAELMATPGFDMNEYVRLQVGAFNRLYNYQIEKSYHSAGLRIETDLNYGKLLPSLFTMYNFTSHDLLIIPEIKVKPSDGLTITAGAEIYSGKKGSLFEIVNDFMSSIYFGIKIDF
jgi:hypothetical protein